MPRLLSFAAVTLIAGAITACHPGGSGGAHVTDKPLPAPQPVVEQAQAQAPEPESLEVSNVAVDSAKASEPDQAPLNLDISSALLNYGEASEDLDFEDRAALPNLFNKDEERRVSTSARLLMDPENPDQIESVDGLEISIKKKL